MDVSEFTGRNVLGFSGDVSDEARRNIRTIGDELAKSEAGTQDSLEGGRSPISANLRSLGLYTEDLSRLVRRSLEVAFSIRTRAGRRRKGLSESSPVRSAGK
jgi:hypothetical protein